MKKFIVVALLTLFAVAVLSSCKSKNCPAYSQVETEQVETNA